MSSDRIDLNIFHCEIIQFLKHIQSSLQEDVLRRAVLDKIISSIKELWPSAKVEAIGSFSTQLCIPSSDIDLVITGRWREPPLRMLELNLLHSGICSKNNARAILGASVPVLKMIETVTRFNVDISFRYYYEHGNPHPRAIANLINYHAQEFPTLRKLVLFFKYFFYQKNLNELYYGGVSSFAVTLMVISFYQRHHDVDLVTHREVNLGSLVMGFLDLYVHQFDNSKFIITIRNGGTYLRKTDYRRQFNDETGMRNYLSFENPICPGKIFHGSLDFAVIKNACEEAVNCIADTLREMSRASRTSSGINFNHRFLEKFIRVRPDDIRRRKWMIENCDLLHQLINSRSINSSRRTPL